METLVYETANGLYLTGQAHLAKSAQDVSAEFSAAVDGWAIEDANPYITWITGDFAEADNPNSNKQFWTKGDLELADYSIRYAPLNMVHKFRNPVGFYAATRKIDLVRDEEAAKKAATDAEVEPQGTMKIEALSGLWSHIFPFEAALVEKANDEGLLFYSMECRGTHLTCAGDQGCGETFEYMKTDTHCEHIKDRASIRHIVNPTFRGGALIVPPVKPGWKNAKASIYSEAVAEQAAKFAEQNEQQYKALVSDGASLTPGAWEMLMSQVLAVSRPTL